MSTITELIRSEADGTISFGNHKLSEKAKLDNYEHAGDIYKVKTYREITRLEKNGLVVYESVPGTSVFAFCEKAEGVSFEMESRTDVQITLGLAEECEYEVFVDSLSSGILKTNLGGKLSFGVELAGKKRAAIKVVKL